MTWVSCSVVVDGDPATVFDYVCDPKESRRWQRDLIHRAPAMPQSGHLTWHEVRALASRPRPVEISLTATSRPDLIEFVATSGSLRAAGDLKFEPAGNRTRIVQRTDIRGRGMMALLAPFIARRVARIGQANLYRLTMQMRNELRGAPAN
jgi:polyketide cyclase/dehydrase/lipid transport protein